VRTGEVVSGLISPVLFSLFANDMPTPFHHLQHVPKSIDSFIWRLFSEVDYWQRDWRIAINVSKSAAMLFAVSVRSIKSPDESNFLESPCSGSKDNDIFG
jgi:hypothetical protein